MTTNWTGRTIVAAGVLLLATAACENDETIAPAGATITLTANPAQVVLVEGIQAVPVTILATVRNSNGSALPDQDVRFSTTSGVLTPQAGLPVSTDNLGNATCTLTGATTGPQITATSGTVTANITLTAATGQVAFITLSPSPLDLVSCNDTFDLTATAYDPGSVGVSGVTIFFEFVNTGAGAVSGTFNPSSNVTDDNGEATTTLTINSNTCNSNCVGKDCSTRIRARDLGVIIVSNEVTINDQILP